MASTAIKRILKERIHYNKNPLNKEGIYIDFSDDNIFNAKVLIIGPENTPYENGFYLFNFDFPKSYPHKPPKGKFYTIDGKIRMNPNLYEEGYICLSLLGTWPGPSWSSSQTLNSICMSIRALVLNDNPIQNEPSFEKEVGIRAQKYKNIIEHENLRIAVCKMLKNTPNGFECFKPQMEKYFVENYDWYIKNAIKNMKKNGKADKSPIYNMNIVYKYKELQDTMESIGTGLGVIPKKFEIIPPPKTKKKKYTRKAPKAPSKMYDLGFQMVSENDGKMYVVSQNKNGVKRWKKVKTN